MGLPAFTPRRRGAVNGRWVVPRTDPTGQLVFMGHHEPHQAQVRALVRFTIRSYPIDLEWQLLAGFTFKLLISLQNY